MKKILTTFLLIMLLSFPFVFAQEVSEVRAGVTPDSVLWGIDRALERIRMLITFGKENKVAYGLQIAEERLAEISEMGKENKLQEINEAEKERHKAINEAKVHAQGLTGEKRIRVANMISKHIENLKQVRDSAPAQAEDKLSRAIEKHERMVERLRLFQDIELIDDE